MKLYMIRWPNGDTSIVGAPTKDEAMLFADSEWADPFDGAEISELKRFAIDMVPSVNEDGYMEFTIDACCGANAGEEWEFLPKAYPIFDAQLDTEFEENDEPDPAHMEKAFQLEMERLVKPDPPEGPERNEIELALGWAPNSPMHGIYERLVLPRGAKLDQLADEVQRFYRERNKT